MFICCNLTTRFYCSTFSYITLASLFSLILQLQKIRMHSNLVSCLGYLSLFGTHICLRCANYLILLLILASEFCDWWISVLEWSVFCSAHGKILYSLPLNFCILALVNHADRYTLLTFQCAWVSYLLYQPVLPSAYCPKRWRGFGLESQAVTAIFVDEKGRVHKPKDWLRLVLIYQT